MRQKFPVSVLGLSIWLILVSTGRTQGGATWEMRAPMPVYRQELATGALNGKLSVLGGYDLAGSSTATVEVYNPVTDTWTFAHNLPNAVNRNAAAVAGGKLIQFCGRCGGGIV